MPYEFTYELTFELKHDYLVMGTAVVALLLLLTIWMFYLSRNRKKKPEKVEAYAEDAMKEDDWEELTEPAYVSYKVPANVTGQKGANEMTSAEKAKKAAKIILPIVGICAAGIAVAVMVRNRRKK